MSGPRRLAITKAAVVPTVGSKEFIAWLPTLLGLGAGDVVVHPEAAYPTYAVGALLAGAEAVAVNGQRLTSRTAIRFAGDAILVNFRPLTRPYTVEAVGDTEAMRARFAAGPGGAYLAGLQQNFGIAATIEPADSLTLPSVASTTLREARPAADGTDPKETS